MAEANPPRENRVSLSTCSDALTDAPKPQNKRYTFSTGSDAMLEGPKSRDKRVSLSTCSDALTDAPTPQTKRFTLSTGSDAMLEYPQVRDKRVSLSTGSDAMPDAPTPLNKRFTLSTRSDAMLDAPQSRDKRVPLMPDAPQDKRYIQSAGSDVIIDLICNRCDNVDELNEAKGYCTECSEHLCKSCIRSHKKATTTKHHKLLDKAHMPRMQTTQSSAYFCTHQCKIHAKEIVKYYCPSHKATGCGVCMTSTHNKCAGKFYIPDKVKNIESSKEFKDFQELISDLTMKSDKVLESLDQDIDASDDYLHNVLHDIEVFRQEMNDALDKCKATIVKKTEEISARDKATMSSAADQTRLVQAELQQMSTDIKTLLHQYAQCQVFIEMKEAKAKLTDFQQQLIDTENIETGFWFKPSEDLQKLVREVDGFGELIAKKVSATHVTDISVKSKGNTKLCWISGSTVLSKDRLITIDYSNETVKLIDTEHQCFISEYKTESAPWDAATVNARQVAVTLPSSMKIVLVEADLEDKLKPNKKIRVNYECLHFAYCDEQLVVGCEDHTVRILSMTGKLLRSIATTSTGKQLFSTTPHVTVSPLYEAIYTTDESTHRVLKLSMDGTVLAQYEDDSLRAPAYTAVDELGRVFVCGGDSNNIHMLTPGCSKGRVLLRGGVKNPRSVSYCPDTRRLYVGGWDTNHMQAYKLS